MSGSGNSGYVPPQRANFDCNKSIITTNVSSINTTILSKYKVGDCLEVTLSKNKPLLLEDGNGEILGAILHTNTLDIIRCMGQGKVFEAEISRIDYPACIVVIQKK